MPPKPVDFQLYIKSVLFYFFCVGNGSAKVRFSLAEGEAGATDSKRSLAASMMPLALTRVVSGNASETASRTPRHTLVLDVEGGT